ncbi:hypothetical protein DSL92_05355 [Billgrantia gudaonensis]|uniref:Uncharacterized protein n=1 Tax=Billgrantia gudaonensis TaxID=376427 RepID=A0A432JJ06_9GAMM|nr:hypothetical protein DSL92_05355 [Halomonas gudaonensis]
MASVLSTYPDDGACRDSSERRNPRRHAQAPGDTERCRSWNWGSSRWRATRARADDGMSGGVGCWC